MSEELPYLIDRVAQCVDELKAAGVDTIGIGAECFATAFAELMNISIQEARPLALVELDGVLSRRLDIERKTRLTSPATDENKPERERYARVVNHVQRSAKRGLDKGFSRSDLGIELMTAALTVMFECNHEVARPVAVGFLERKTDEIAAVVKGCSKPAK